MTHCGQHSSLRLLAAETARKPKKSGQASLIPHGQSGKTDGSSDREPPTRKHPAVSHPPRFASPGLRGGSKFFWWDPAKATSSCFGCGNQVGQCNELVFKHRQAAAERDVIHAQFLNAVGWRELPEIECRAHFFGTSRGIMAGYDVRPSLTIDYRTRACLRA